MKSSVCYPVSTPGEESSPDLLHVAFVAERAQHYNLNIAAKLQLIDELAEMVGSARKSYRENLSKT